MTAIMWAYAVAGFWTGSSYQLLPYADIGACERERTVVELRMRAMGYSGVITNCKVTKERL